MWGVGSEAGAKRQPVQGVLWGTVPLRISRRQQRAHTSESFHLSGGESWGFYPPVPISQSQGLLPGELLIPQQSCNQRAPLDRSTEGV